MNSPALAVYWSLVEESLDEVFLKGLFLFLWTVLQMLDVKKRPSLFLVNSLALLIDRNSTGTKIYSLELD